MSRWMQCDICDTAMEGSEPVMVVQVPSEWLPPFDAGEPLLLDICSLLCVRTMGNALENQTLGQELPAHAPTPPVTGESPDQGDDDGERRYAPDEPSPVDTSFLSPVKVRTKGER